MRALSRNALVFAAAAFPTTLAAQGVTVRSMTDVAFHGALGAIAGIAAKLGGGGDMREISSTTYVSGHKLRTESGTTAMIIDVDAGRVTNIDNKAKTYTSMTFDEMAEMMKRAQQSAKQQMKEEQAKDPNAPKGDVDVKYKVSVDRPGQREKVAGYDAERMFITITMEGEATPEGEKSEKVGSLVFLLDQWVSKEAPQYLATQEFQRAYAAKAGQEFRSQTQALQAAFASDPRIKDGFEAAAREMAKVQGMPLRTTTYVSGVPAGMTFDRELALNDGAAAPAKEKTEKPKGGLRGLVGKIKNAAEEANKQPEQTPGPPKQGTLVTVKDEVQSITPGAVPAELFVPPAGYREIKPQPIPR